MSDCPFCDIPADRVIRENRNAIAFHDAYPVSPGHTLVIPRRHVASALDLEEDELEDMMILIDICTHELQQQGADGFNIGVNVGRAAGQTVMHVHFHIIPRYINDQPDPRGGIRKIFPEKAAYWNPIP
jgi:diadenosine tetraphosphate (Ap4A) HIT family hydrolase